jgi:hypothetical protein
MRAGVPEPRNLLQTDQVRILRFWPFIAAGLERELAAVVAPEAVAADPADFLELGSLLGGGRLAIADEEVVVKAVVAARGDRQARHRGGMGGMIRRLAVRFGPVGDFAGEQVVRVSPPWDMSSRLVGERKRLLSTMNGPWLTSTKRSSLMLSWKRLRVTRVPWAIQSSQRPRWVR